MSRDVRVVRVYDPPAEGEGTRVLVDRLWPRGVRKSEARIQEWCKHVAPSADLRSWYGHTPEKFDEFRVRYAHELEDDDHQQALAELEELADRGPLTLVTASRDVPISHAAVLADRLQNPKR